MTVDAPSSELLLAWMSFTSIPLNIFGGTIYANPFNQQFFFFSNSDGRWSASIVWPPAIPGGIDVYLQFLMQDLTLLSGINISNAVMATTP